MGFRFRKSIRILPGLKINLSKSGTSVTLGGRGLSYNVNKNGTRTTVGIPGTGISYSTNTKHQSSVPNPSPTQFQATNKNGITLKQVFLFGFLAWLAYVILSQV